MIRNTRVPDWKQTAKYPQFIVSALTPQGAPRQVLQGSDTVLQILVGKEKLRVEWHCSVGKSKRLNILIHC